MEACSTKIRSTRSLTRRTVAVSLLVGLFAGMYAPCVTAQQTSTDLSNLSLESLTSMEITTVAKKGQKLTEAAAAIFVITSEDIRRSGLSSIAELLRTVPGLEVASINANEWAITTRGFNERYADRTLFLMDGRTMYTPLTSGVNWDVQETMLEDIERIEIIRGPGATLWGANAMNGVVNIITKKAQDTQGLLVTLRGSDQDRNSASVRFGGNIGTRGHYRVFGKYLNREGSHRPSGEVAPDEWSELRSGFRSDWDLSGKSTLTLEGDIYKAHVGETAVGIVSLTNPFGDPFPDKTNTSGGDISARWSKMSAHLDTSVQAYFDLTNRDEVGEIGEYSHTFDVSFSQNFHSGSRHNVSWGGNIRDNSDRMVGSFNVSFDPAKRELQLYGAYLQDEIAMLAERMKLTLGGKLEHSYYNGFVLQPNARLIWVPSARTSVWTSVARAASSPSRSDADIRFNGALVTDPAGNITLYSHFGTNHLAPEVVLSYEFGVRHAPHPKVSFDLATFYNHYSNFHTNEPGTPFMETGHSLPPHLVIPDYVDSNRTAMTRGVELLMETHPAKFWKLSASYTALLIRAGKSPTSLDFQSSGDSEHSAPRNQGQVHSLINLPRKFEFDSSVFYVGKLPAAEIKPYTRVDFRLGWRPMPSLEFSAGGRNLLQAVHMEFGSGETVQAEPVGRSAYFKATWSF